MLFQKKKLAAAVAALTFAAGVPAVLYPQVQAAAVSQASIDAKSQLGNELSQLAPASERNMTFVSVMKTGMGENVNEGFISFETEPSFTAQGNLKTATAVNGKEQVTAMPFYIQQTDKGSMAYFQTPDKKWQKSAIKADNLVDFLGGAFEKEFLQKLLLTAKDVSCYPDDNGIEKTYMLTVNGSMLQPILPTMPENESFNGISGAVWNKAMGSLGDFKVKIRIDNERHQITAMEADLSEPMHRVAKVMAEDPAYAPLASQLENGYFAVALQAGPNNILSNITVPKDVLKKAKNVD